MPAWNEALQIGPSIDAVCEALKRIGVTWELLVVDDGSIDQTFAIAVEREKSDARVRVVRHTTNRGVGQAIATGLAHAKGEWFMVIPADLAIDLEDLGRYFAAATDVAVVAGYTASRSDYTVWREVVSSINRFAVAILAGVSIRNPNYIHLYRAEVLRSRPLHCIGSAAIFAEFLSVAATTGRIVEIPVRYVPRTVGNATGAKWGLIRTTAFDLVSLGVRRFIAFIRAD